MDDGIHALKGFIYQATVILDVLLPFFEEHSGARARPEGTDDLELAWTEDGEPRCVYIQIKKPSEDAHGRLKGRLWTLTEVAQALLPAAISHLHGNGHEQRWILGDDVDPEVRGLVAAAREAPSIALREYLHALHILAREQSGVTGDLAQEDRRSIGQWRFDLDIGTAPETALERMIATFSSRMIKLGVTTERTCLYGETVRELHHNLPDVLSRIRVETTFGRDDDVRRRVCERLAQTYPISPQRVADTIFGNMRLFVDDVAVCRGTWIDRDALDALVARVWPEMMPLREPPPLPEPYIERRDLVEKILDAMPCRALEVVGVAGSGKTSLARAVYDHVKRAVSGVDVVYAEVRRDRTLREVLAGLAMHMKSRGVAAPRDAAELSGITEEERVRQVAHALRDVQGRTLILVDLVDGSCDEEFTRLLSIFLQAGPHGSCTLVIFGQESALGGLTALEKELAGIPARIEQNGFHFEEFAALVSHFHANLDRERLWNVYQLATSGRVAGLFARLAYDLARAPSIQAMERIVGGPADTMVPRAIRERLDHVTPALRPAAEKLACLLLPFRPTEVTEVFSQDPVKAAIDRLLDLGLLHHHDAERLEMHETVRRGIEDNISPAQRQEAHRALATWHGQQGHLLAEIHHLDRAGDQEEAHRKSREAFLAGRHAYGLMDYVAKHRLVTDAQLADSMLRGTPLELAQVIPRILQRLGNSGTAEILMTGLRSQATRFDTDYQWAWRMVESILACDPGRLYELTLFGLAAPRGKDGQVSATRLEWIALGARRGDVRIDERLLALFETRDDDVKWKMLQLMVLDPRRGVLEKVLPFVNAHERKQQNRRSWVARRGPPILLPLRSQEEIVAFLGAIPLADTSAIILAKAPQLGRVAELVWAAREHLQPISIELLELGHDDDAVLENALRVLILLGDQRSVAASERYRERKSRLGTLATFLPALFPQHVEQGHYEARLLDPSRDINKRIGDGWVA